MGHARGGAGVPRPVHSFRLARCPAVRECFDRAQSDWMGGHETEMTDTDHSSAGLGPLEPHLTDQKADTWTMSEPITWAGPTAEGARSRFGRFELLGRIGAGGSGIVFRARPAVGPSRGAQGRPGRNAGLQGGQAAICPRGPRAGGPAASEHHPGSRSGRGRGTPLYCRGTVRGPQSGRVAAGGARSAARGAGAACRAAALARWRGPSRMRTRSASCTAI